MAINQAYLFFIFTLNGVFIGLLFDFFRILRKSFKTKNFITYIEDITFWILTGISIIFSMYNFSGGSLRFFMFLGLCFGIVVYILTLSRLIIEISIFIISLIKKTANKIAKNLIEPLKVIYKILDKVLFRPLLLILYKIKFVFYKKMQKLNKKTKKI